MTNVDELKEPDYGITTEETEKHAICQCGESKDDKLVTAVDELKGPDCGITTKDTEKNEVRQYRWKY